MDQAGLRVTSRWGEAPKKGGRFGRKLEALSLGAGGAEPVDLAPGCASEANGSGFSFSYTALLGDELPLSGDHPQTLWSPGPHPPTCPCAHPGGAAAPTALPGPMLRRCSRASGCGQPLPYLLIRVSTPPPAASWGWGLPVSPCREVLLAVLSPRTEPTGQRLPFAVSTELKIDAFQCLAVCWCRCIFSLACFFFLLFVNTLFI